MKKNVWLTLVGTLWFFVIIDSFFTWNRFSLLFHVLPSIIIIFGSLSFEHQKKQLKKYKTAFLPLSIFVLWKLATGENNIGGLLVKVLDFIPIFFIMIWPVEYLRKLYVVIRNIFVFYAVGSFVIFVLSVLGILNEIPHFELPPQETIHVESGAFYNVYGVFVVLVKSDFIVTIVRSCGMTLEPGHFAIYLGFIYLIERYLGKGVNYILILGAISTFSSTFFIMLFFTELLLNLTKFKINKFVKYFMLVSAFVLALTTIYSILPTETKDAITYKAYGRNLESVSDAWEASESLDEALNERASKSAIDHFNRLDTMSFLFGGEKIGKGNILSDYRGMIISVGIMGLLLSLLAFMTIVCHASFKHALTLFLCFTLVLLHRSWMLYEPYTYTLAYISVALCGVSDEMSYRSKMKIHKVKSYTMFLK